MRTDPVRLALTVAGFLAVGGTPTAAMLIFLIVVAVLLAISMWRSVRLATILALLAGAILMRVALMDRTGSDVLTVTAAAIDRMLEGGNPYGTGYAESRPPGASYPYGPLALLWYLPLRSRPDIIELGAAIAVALIFALRGRLVGLAVYAASTALVAAAVDGSNDTSLGLLLLGAFMAAERWPAPGRAPLLPGRGCAGRHARAAQVARRGHPRRRRSLRRDPARRELGTFAYFAGLAPLVCWRLDD